jgi:hypothetical protein
MIRVWHQVRLKQLKSKVKMDNQFLQLQPLQIHIKMVLHQQLQVVVDSLPLNHKLGNRKLLLLRQIQKDRNIKKVAKLNNNSSNNQ